MAEEEELEEPEVFVFTCPYDGIVFASTEKAEALIQYSVHLRLKHKKGLRM